MAFMLKIETAHPITEYDLLIALNTLPFTLKLSEPKKIL
jgi:hypothetical protein